MAITVTARGSRSGYLNNFDVPATGFTPAGNSVILITIPGWTWKVTGVTGWGETFTQITSHQTPDSRTLLVYAAIMPASPASDSATVATSDSGNFDCAIVEIGGDIDTSGGIASFFAQEITDAVYGAGTGNAIGTGFASSFDNSNSGTLIIPFSNYSTQTFTPMTNFASIQTASGTIVGNDIQFYNSEESDPEYTVTTGGTNDAAIAYELLGSGGGGSSSIPAIMHHRRLMQ